MVLTLPLRSGSQPPLRVLAIGAHPDDIEIGCGGTILRLIADGQVASIRWVVLSGTTARAAEAQAGASAFLEGVPEREVILRDFRDGFLPYEGGRVKQAFEELKGSFDPDIVFCSRREDQHQDHRLTSELTWNTYRDHLILEYEIPKYDGDLGTPNVFVDLSESLCRRKIDLIRGAFRSQGDRSWFTEDTFWALLRLRGIECNAPGRYAEAFVCRKIRI